MNDCKNESKCLASLAVFRELFNSKKDVYGVISEFLKEVIIKNSKHQFVVSEITELLNRTYDFHIPPAIVQTSLKRLDFLEKVDGQFIAKNISNIAQTSITQEKEQLEKSNNHIIENLFTYIEEKQDLSLNDNEKEKVVHSLCSFMLDDSNGEDYSEYISSFIIENKKNLDFTNQLNQIKEGVVLYSGIKYNTNINDTGSWTTPLTIYIETEILFHFAGFNGQIFKTLFEDFFSFVKEINSKSSQKLIHLKYFVEVKDEIEKFFKKAEYIVDGKDKANPAITAMREITDGCDSPADVVMKKTKFYDLLKVHGIQEDKYSDYFSPKNHQYNIISQETLDKVSNDLELDDIRENLRFLNYINIHRQKSYNNNFENIKFILLSGNSSTLKVAWHDEIKEQGNVPLATNLSFLTNKFWFKLNKGFGDNNFPKTFDVVTKAQIILSSQVNENVSKKFVEFQNDFKNGKITEKEAVSTIANLRSQARKPEDIESDDVNSVLDSISEKSIHDHLEEQALFKSQAEKEATENKKLKEDIRLKEEAFQAELEAKKIREAEIQSEKIKHLQELLTEKESSIGQMKNQKLPIDGIVRRRFNTYKLLIGSAFVLYYFISYYLIWKLSWNFMEQWTYIVHGTFPLIISFLYILIKEKTINPIKYLNNLRQRIEIKQYLKFSFDINRLNTLIDEKTRLNEELKAIKASTQHAVISNAG